MAEIEFRKKGKLLDQYADAVSAEIGKCLQDAVHLSGDNFLELKKFHKLIDWSNIAQQCDQKIRDKIGHQFEETWEAFNMKTKISLLELLKKRTKNKDIQQWRPYQKSPSEQCRPYIMEILDGKNYYLQEYLKDQQTRLVEEIIPAIDEYRAKIRTINERREQLLSQMERMEETNKHTNEKIEELDGDLKHLMHLNRGYDEHEEEHQQPR